MVIYRKIIWILHNYAGSQEEKYRIYLQLEAYTRLQIFPNPPIPAYFIPYPVVCWNFFPTLPIPARFVPNPVPAPRFFESPTLQIVETLTPTLSQTHVCSSSLVYVVLLVVIYKRLHQKPCLLGLFMAYCLSTDVKEKSIGLSTLLECCTWSSLTHCRCQCQLCIYYSAESLLRWVCWVTVEEVRLK